MHSEPISLQDKTTPELLSDWVQSIGNGETASRLRSELMARGFTPSDLARRRMHASRRSATQSRTGLSYFYLHRYIETGLNWIWAFIQLALAVLALASLGDLFFFGREYGSKSSVYLDHYWQLLMLFAAVAVIPRILLVKFPVLAIPYVALTLMAIRALHWCIANSKLALADGSPIFLVVLPLVYFLAADAVILLFYWLAARAVQARKNRRLNYFG